MALTISNIETDLPKLNSELSRLDRHTNDIASLKQELSNLKDQVLVEHLRNGVQNQNNIVFTWTGGSLTISWAPGYVKDHQGHYDPIPAGSQTAAASTYYWVGWNPVHQTMSFNTSLDALTQSKQVLVLCQFFTGTGGQTGSLGGGGTEPGGGQGLNGKQYKLF